MGAPFLFLSLQPQSEEKVDFDTTENNEPVIIQIKIPD